MFLLTVFACTLAHADDAHATDASTWLEKIDQRMDKIESLKAIVRYDTIQGLVGDSQTRFGQLVYNGQRPRQFAVRFTGIVYGQPPLKPLDERLVFDGRHLAEIKPNEKVFTRWELVEEGENTDDLFDMTNNRFPLPLDLDPQKIEQGFEAVQIDPVQPDPVQNKAVPNTVQIRLTPRPEIDAGYEQMDIWFDRETCLPVLVHTLDAGDSGDEAVIRLSNVETDVTLTDNQFNTDPPLENDWQVELVPLERKTVEQESHITVLPAEEN